MEDSSSVVAILRSLQLPKLTLCPRWRKLRHSIGGGIADLQTTAEHGHYLAPFARIFLSIAYVREKDKSRSLQLLTGLQPEFPENALFPREIARLQAVQ